MQLIIQHTPIVASAMLLLLLANQKTLKHTAPIWEWLAKSAVFIVAALLLVPFFHTITN